MPDGFLTHWRFPFLFNGRKRYSFPFRDDDNNRVWKFPFNQPSAGSGGGGDAYVADAVHFNGSARLSIASLTAADSGLLTVSAYIRSTHLASFFLFVVDPENNYNVDAVANSITKLRVDSNTATYSNGITVVSPADTLVSDTWMNLLISQNLNLSAGNKVCQMYVNDAVITPDIFVDNSAAFVLSYAGVPFTVLNDFFNLYEGDAADLWIAPGQFIDFSVEANRRKFIDADGKPVSLGADGSTPTGTAPAVFFSGDSSSFATNKGTGGAFTLTGSLTDALTSPSD
jgi:hypothetical protein